MSSRSIANRLAVVVITHDRQAELACTLQRLAEVPDDPVVIIVDNGSTDGTAQYVAATHPDVVLLRLGRNLGAVGRNLGVAAAAARGLDHVAFCDDDTWYEPGALNRAVELLDAHPNVGLLNASIIVEPDGRIDGISEEMARSPLPNRPDLPGAPLLSFLAGVSILRRRAFEEAGGFSPQLWLGGEEELLASDLVRAGWKMRYVPELRAHHRPSISRDAHLRRRHGIRNTLWFTWARRRPSGAIRRTVHLLAGLPRDLVSAGAITDALAGLPWVLRNRRPVPARMEAGYRLLEDDQLHGGNRRYVS